MDKESIKRVSALAVAAVLLALLLGNVIFRSPIRDLNMAAAVAVAALAFMVGLSTVFCQVKIPGSAKKFPWY